MELRSGSVRWLSEMVDVTIRSSQCIVRQSPLKGAYIYDKPPWCISLWLPLPLMYI